MSRSPQDCKYGNRSLKFFKKWHRWPGVIMGFFFVLWAISGVVMNHRQLLSVLDISRDLLPKEYHYVNWNNAAVKSAVKLSPDSLLIYGNVGIWLTDSTFSSFTDYNKGFPEGIDNRKISSMLVTGNGNVYAGTLFGLFYYDRDSKEWEKLDIPLKDERIQWLVEKRNELIILTRSEMLEAHDDPGHFVATVLPLPAPEGYDDKAGLFRTIWVIHSGEIYGKTGRLIVDLIAFTVILLSITGILHFSMPYALRRLKKRKKPLNRASATKRFSAKWHKKVGIWIAIFILINTVTGMFLRPPLLITIANARIGKIPFSVLDTPNPWEDKLRAVIYDEEFGGYILGTSDGLFFADKNLERQLVPLPGQPPLSVMGINVFRKTGHGKYLVGSFNGLYDWILGDGVSLKGDSISFVPDGVSFNHLTGKPALQMNTARKPFGDEMAGGDLVFDNRKEVYFDYNKGALTLNDEAFPPMPQEMLKKSPMSLWNFALEIHTGRIFKPLMGDFYILLVPLFGIFGTILVISGIIVWIKLYARKHLKIHSSST